MAALGLVILLALHLFWRSDEAALYAGWLPRELGYRVLWMVLAWAYLIYFCRYLWRADSGADGDPPGQTPSLPDARHGDEEAG